VLLQGVSKRFGETVALADAHLEIRPGEIHVLLGENGAGKSSLISVAAGLYHPDSGHLEISGKAVVLRSPADALALGVVLVPQHPELIPNLTCWENVILGSEGGRLLSRTSLRKRVAALASTNGIDVNLDAVVNRISAGEQLKVELLKMLHRNATALILDEPTTFLTPQESDALFATLDNLKRNGIAVVLVTHKLRDAVRVGDTLSVMRNGSVVATLKRGEAGESDLVRLVTGSDTLKSAVESAAIGADSIQGDARSAATPSISEDRSEEATEVLSIEHISTETGLRLRDITLKLNSGDIHGLAGIAGSGQRELAETLLGIIPESEGTIRICNEVIAGWSVSRRREAGLGVIPEDRIRDAILPGASLWENFALGSQDRLFGRLRLDSSAAHTLTSQGIERFDIKAPSPDASISKLSGGNIQKVIVARLLNQAANHAHFALIALYPTRGLDVASTARVWEGMRKIADSGGAVLVVSEDLDELMAMCGSISVLHHGSIVHTFLRPEFSRYGIGEAMLGKLRSEPVGGEQHDG